MCGSAGGGGGPASCVVFEEHGFDEFADGGLFVGVEVSGGFEGEFEVVRGAAFVGVEQKAVGGDGERDCDVAQGFEGRCGGAGLVASDLGDVHSGAVGECLLGELGVFAGCRESGGEGHVDLMVRLVVRGRVPAARGSRLALNRVAS